MASRKRAGSPLFSVFCLTSSLSPEMEDTLKMNTSSANFLLILLLFPLLFKSGCSYRANNSGKYSTLPRLAVMAEEGQIEGDLVAAYRQVTGSIANRLTRQQFDVVRFDSAGGWNTDAKGFRTNYRNLMAKYGLDGIIFVHLENLETRKDDTSICRIRLSLDSFGIDAGGRDLGVSFGRSTTASRQSCSSAIRDAARDLGYFAGNIIANHLGKMDSERNGTIGNVEEGMQNENGFN